MSDEMDVSWGPWLPWFAWRPVATPDGLTWLRMLERRRGCWGLWVFVAYRRPADVPHAECGR